MKSRRWLAGLGLLFSVNSAYAIDIIFSDEFDTYSGTYLPAASAGVWVSDGCNDGKLSANAPLSAPQAVFDYKDGGTNKRLSFRNRHHLTAAEMLGATVKESQTPNCVDGTDNNPLQLEFQVYLGPWSTVYYYKVNQYMELSCGTDQAPTPMLVADCSGLPRHHLNLAGDGLVHKTLAVGQVAFADPDPCDVSSEKVQQNYRLSVYDGLQWRYFTSDDLHTCSGWNYVRLTVRTNNIDITIRNKYLAGCAKANADQTRTITLNRNYKGPFTSLAMGGLPDLENGGCWDGNKDDGFLIQESGFENVYLYDGVARNVNGVCEDDGACCKGDYTCEQLTPTACQAIQGATFEGLGTACGIGVGRCCADPAVDSDHDTDVDMVDFAKLQRCLTTGGGLIEPGCECFDTNGDGAIGETDVIKFADCASGSGIAADPACDNPVTP